MFATKIQSRTKRRGIVLVLILGMLGLLALIGVTFATFSNQSQINARNFSQSASFPDPSEMFDFALAQLINDTANPASVIRGHSLKRDMYGADATFNGALLNGMPGSGTPMMVSSALVVPSGKPYAGMVQLTTNLPSTSTAAGQQTLYGYNFTRWILTYSGAIDTTNAETYVGRTHEIIVDDAVGDGTNRQFYVAIPNSDVFTVSTIANSVMPGTIGALPPFDSPASTFTAVAPMIQGYSSPEAGNNWKSTLTTFPGSNGLPSSSTLPAYTPVFTLDGRYLHAFNGPGLAGMNSIGLDTTLLSNSTGATAPATSHPLAEFANFRYNGNIFVNLITATSNANAVGTFTPGYGDPNSIPVSMDEDYDACDLENWFLAIQSGDGKVVIPSFHRPGIVTGADWSRTVAAAGTDAGQQLVATRAMSRILRPRAIDGHSSIAFPDLTPDPTTGQIKYDIDNDGDGQTDSVWLDLGYAPKRNPEGKLYKPLFAFMVIGLNGRLPLNTAGNLQARDDLCQPLFDHAEHLGNSPSEIDLKYALQNAWSTYDPTVQTTPPYTQSDDAFVASIGDSAIPVNLTQLRNILAGTRPWIGQPAVNGDQNVVIVNNQPIFLPNNVADGADSPSPTGPGSNVYRANPSVAGRWGESGGVPGLASNPLVTGPAGPSGTPAFTLVFNNPVRAGYSVIPYGGMAFDARDDNFTTFDLNGEAADYYDAAGALALPVERYRRFVTPVDIAGDGRVITYNTYVYNPGAGNQSAQYNGADLWGRVSFLRYFRPPGMPLNTFSLGVTPTSGNPVPLSAANGATIPAPLSAGQISLWFDKGIIPTAPAMTNHLDPDPTSATYHPFFYDTRTNNPYHGYINALTPDFQGQNTTAPTNGLSGLPLAGMPSDLYYPGSPAYTYTTPTPYTTVSAIGTVDQVQTNPGGSPPNYITTPTFNISTYPYGVVNSNPGFISPGLNEADEMNLYIPSALDSPFGAGDLEWLYRYQDVDGAALTSRLQYLAPISFLNPGDGPRRRRLVCLDTWEPTNFVWANDNPSGVFTGNSRFNALTSSSFPNLYNLGNRNITLSPDPAADFSVLSNSSNSAPFPVQTPSIAHRDRRVNLNFPLPVSNSPIEPVRQKWIRETYQLLKAILPPKAVDTPEELAQLSQYVVNMIDFRDPDATMTKFVNTDLIVTEPPILASGLTTSQATLTYSTGNAPAIAYDPTYTFEAPAAPTTFTAGTNPALVQHYLIQYGMEYQPVAINEVLAYQFQTKNDPNNPTTNTAPGLPKNDTPRLVMELVNMLTKDAIQGNFPDSSDLDLVNYDFVVLPDDAHGRPDPFTGQVPLTQPGLFMPPAPPSGYNGAPLLPGGYDSSKVPNQWVQPFVSISAAGGSLAQLAPTATVPAGTGNPQVAQTFAGVNPPLSALSTRNKNGDKPGGSTSVPMVYYYVFGNMPPYQQWQSATPPPTPQFSENAVSSYPAGYAALPSAYTTYPLTANPSASPATPATPIATGAGVIFPNTLPSTLNTQLTTQGTASPPLVIPSGYVDLTGLLYQRAVPPNAPPTTVPGPNNIPTPPATTPPANQLYPGYYYWLYLRRPADPFDPTSDRVVVDSFRFIFTKSQGIGYQNSGADAVSPNNLNAAGTDYIFSLERLQPYRGGHAIPPLTESTTALSTYTAYAMAAPANTTAPANAATAATSLLPSYGFSEQTHACQAGTEWGLYNKTQSTGTIYHTLGARNSFVDNARDYFPFNDRDYTSVIELLNVPASAPGLFTKQFVELPPPLQPTYQCLQALAYTTPAASQTWPALGPLSTNPNPTTPATGWGSTAIGFGTSAKAPSTSTYPNAYPSPWPYNVSTLPTQLSANAAPHPFPYLNDEFYYTGASEPATWTIGEATAPIAGTTPTPAPPTTSPAPTGGLTPPATFRSLTAPYNYIGGASGAGYHKILDFFEVPTPAFGAIGEVSAGVNYDWKRQDLRPGLLNLNLIIDEEVFFGLMGHSIAQYLNTGQIGMPNSPSYGAASTPSVVTQVNDAGAVTHSYHMPSIGFYAGNGFVDPANGSAYPQSNAGVQATANAGMKAAFADFLSLRHGGTGFVFGNGVGSQVGQTSPLAAERPFHSLSYPDINYTIMRPAALPPSTLTTPTANPAVISYPLLAQPTLPTTPPTVASVANASLVPVTGYVNGTAGNYTPNFIWDPGIKNPYLSVFPSAASGSNNFAIVQPPAIPPRRLFQFADAYGSYGVAAFPNGSSVQPATSPAPLNPPSNASIPGDPNINIQTQVSVGLTAINTGTGGYTTAYPNLVAPPNQTIATTAPAPPALSYLSDYLGGQFFDGSSATNLWPNPGGAYDQTDHPYFRTEWLQKVTNLTTVRTHQYAVWITVGFFEVTAQGDPTLAVANPFLAYDQLGNELGYLDGSNRRYRGFFLVDRTRAVGFNPFQPDDFRNCVVYRQLIE